MFEELNAHRQAVQENIKKAFEIGFTGNEYLEKAYQVGDEQTDKHGVTYYVHAFNAAGKPLWRKKKDSGAKATNSGSAPINTQSQKKVGKDNSDISFQLFDRKSGHEKYYEIYPIPNELKNSSFIRVISAQDSKSGRKEFVPEIEFKDGEKFSERLFSKKDAIDFIIERILEKRDKATNSSLTEREKKEKSLLESAVRSGRRLSQRDANRLYALQRKERQAATTAENISKSFETDFEKGRDGVYVDNSENRRLGRVGMSYTNGFKRGARVTATLPTGKVISGKFEEFYGNGKYASIKTDDGHTYGVTPDKVKLQSSPKKSSEKKADVNKIKSQIRDLQRERRAVEVDMEEELAQLGEEAINNGNNPVVKRYSSMLDKIDSKISNLQSKIQPERKRVFHSYESYMKEKPVEGEDYHYE